MKRITRTIRKLVNPRRHRARGQSLPLLALMIIVLIGFVGLSVDVGNTYQEQRKLVSATNAASISAMQVYLTAGTTDADVFNAINTAFAENGITIVPYGQQDLAPNERGMQAFYLDQNGNPLGCDVGNCPSRPGDARYIQVQTQGTVDSLFAQVFNVTQFPVGTAAYAGSCPPVDGVYPLAISAGALNSDGEFINGDGTIVLNDVASTLGSELKWRRLYLQPVDGTPQIGLVRWRDSYGTGQVDTMLTIPGNLKFGFEEAPFVETEDGVGTADTYPNEPRVLSTDDWMYGYSNDDFQSLLVGALGDELDTLRSTRTRLILPIYNATAANPSDGNNPTYRMGDFGTFYIKDHGTDEFGTYIELISLGTIDSPRGTPCLAQNVDVPEDQRYGILGPVAVRPAWAERNIIPDDQIKPAGYTIILDVSGSMSYSIEGWGSWLYKGGDGRDYQCESFNPAIDLPYFRNVHGGSCEGGNKAPWRTENGRRIFEAREAILDIADGMIPEDRIRIITFNSDLNSVSGKWYAPEDPELPDEVRTIGQCCTSEAGKSPSYLTSGGTAGADGMDKAFEFIKSSDFPSEYIPLGSETKQDNRRVIIYMTDGVSNQMFKSNDGSPGRPECAGLNIANIAWCNIGYAADGRELPIQSMIRLSREMHTDMNNRGYDDFRLFVLAMGRFDTQGLADVATSPADLYEARDTASISAFLSRISTEVKYDECLVREAKPGEEVRSITGSSTPDDSAAQYFRGITPRDLSGESQYDADVREHGAVYGYAVIQREGDSLQIWVPIVQGSDGQLAFRIDPDEPGEAEADRRLTPGRYVLTAEIAYRGQDGVTRIYNQFWEDGERKASTTFSISASRAGGPLGDVVPLPLITLVLPTETVQGIDQECS